MRHQLFGLASFLDGLDTFGISWLGLLVSPRFLDALNACGVSWLGLRPRFFFGWRGYTLN